MSRYKNIFFDLDNTLWDFTANARDTFNEIFSIFNLWNTIGSIDRFIEAFIFYNDELWDKYRKGQINKEVLRTERFRLTLKKLNIRSKDLSQLISNAYFELMPQKTILMRHAHEVLEYLKTRYHLLILTNGFPEIQQAKIKNSGIDSYFDRVVTARDAGYKKPDSRIFGYALTTINGRKSEAIMIGDDLQVDIEGAMKFGMDQVFFNRKMISHNLPVTYEVKDIKELLHIF